MTLTPVPPHSTNSISSGQNNSCAKVVSFRGMSDASGAVALSSHLFMVADDEDNILRVYNAELGGDPIDTYPLSPELFETLSSSNESKPEKSGSKKSKNKKNDKKEEISELDLEAAAEMDGISFWITSHARNSKGKQKLERFHLFGLIQSAEQNGLHLLGKPYTRLLDDLIADARFAKFDLAGASQKAAKAEQSVNIEGMTARQDGGVYIGFRNPITKGRALIVTLTNPKDVIFGAAPQFEDPIELDLGGLGIRGLCYWKGHYLIAAGNSGVELQAAIFSWQGENSLPIKLPYQLPEDFNPETFFTPEDRDEFMLLSDDGSLVVDGTENKKLKDSKEKTFRGIWLSDLMVV
jgi:Protein of unknown function (DUF3616)